MSSVRISPRAIIRRGDAYLVVRYRDKEGDWFVFPGGGQQHGESLHEALLREVHEETGATITIGSLRFVRECIAARNPTSGLPVDFQQLELFFECSILVESIQPGAVPDPGQTGIEWLSASELQSRRFFPKALLAKLDDSDGLYLGVC